MKKILLLCLLFLVSSMAFAQLSAGGTLYVSSRTLNLRSSTGWFARNTGTLEYGDRVSVLRVDGRFVEVSSSNPAISGWADSSNFSTRQLLPGSTGSTNVREVALAGKGFDRDVENSYRARGNFNYADVDRMELFNLDEQQIWDFLEEGRLFFGDSR